MMPWPLVAALAFAVDAPEPGKEIYWLVGVMAAGIGGVASAVGVIFWQLLKSKDDRHTDCLTDKTACSTEKRACTDSLAATVEAQRTLTAEVKVNSDGDREWRASNDRRLEGIERGVADLQSRNRGRS